MGGGGGGEAEKYSCEGKLNERIHTRQRSCKGLKKFILGKGFERKFMRLENSPPSAYSNGPSLRFDCTFLISQSNKSNKSIERLGVMFTANGKCEVQVKNFFTRK